MKKKYKYLVVLFVSALIILIVSSGCREKETYDEILKKELSKGVRYDSLFYGLHFNMTTPRFAQHCIDMNALGVFFPNSGQSQIIIKFQNEFEFPVNFVFFPNLEKDRIQKIQGSFNYYGSYASSKDRNAKILILELVEQMTHWYGGRAFIKQPHPLKLLGYRYIKIDGNRKITLEENLDNVHVDVIFEDLMPTL